MYGQSFWMKSEGLPIDESLKSSTNNDFCLDILNKMDSFVLKQMDFY